MLKLVRFPFLVRAAGLAIALSAASTAIGSEFVGLDSTSKKLYSFGTSGSPPVLLGVVSNGPQFGFGPMDRSPDGSLYATAPGAVSGYSIVRIDESALTSTTIATIATNSTGNVGFAIDPTGTKAFVIGYVGLSLNLKLQEVNLATGTMTERGQWTASAIGLGFDAAGQLYSLVHVNATQVRLYRVNTANAANSVPVGAAFSGVDTAQGADLASDRGSGFVHAYARASSQIYSLDTAVGGIVATNTLIGMPGVSTIASNVSCQGTIVPYGSGCAGSGGFVPQLSIDGCPGVGGQLEFAISQGLGGSSALLFIGLGPGVVPVGAGCSFYLSGLLPASLSLPLSAGGPGGGSIAFNATLPAGVNGMTFTTQAWVVDPAVAIGGAGTHGVQVAIAP